MPTILVAGQNAAHDVLSDAVNGVWEIPTGPLDGPGVVAVTGTIPAGSTILLDIWSPTRVTSVTDTQGHVYVEVDGLNQSVVQDGWITTYWACLGTTHDFVSGTDSVLITNGDTTPTNQPWVGIFGITGIANTAPDFKHMEAAGTDGEIIDLTTDTLTAPQSVIIGITSSWVTNNPSASDIAAGFTSGDVDGSEYGINFKSVSGSAPVQWRLPGFAGSVGNLGFAALFAFAALAPIMQPFPSKQPRAYARHQRHSRLNQQRHARQELQWVTSEANRLGTTVATIWGYLATNTAEQIRRAATLTDLRQPN